MARTTLKVPFGEGIQRAEGAFLIQPSSFRDLRNVHLTGQRMEVRRGLEQKALVVDGVTDILAIHPLRAALQSLIVCYNDATRSVTLQRAAIDPSTLAVTLTAVATPIWTIPVTAPFPVVRVTDSYGKAFIAHDEAAFPLRQNTKVYDPSTGIATDLVFDTDPAAPMNLRWVRRWLSYVVGSGYGTSSLGPPDDRNRAEIVRLSLPGDPEIFDPNYYFAVGQRGEPSLGGAQCRDGFVVAKEGELHLITGTSPTDFDTELIDPNFGVVSGTSMVEVGGAVYFWSAEGPRVTIGQESMDLALPLDLRGRIPDEILTSTDLRYCTGTFRPDREEIEWIFPASGRDASWSYVLDLKTAEKRLWSYRRYSTLVRSAGLLAGNIAFDPGDPVVAPYLTLDSFSLAANSYTKHIVSWTNANVANLPASSVVEIWASGGTASFDATGLPWAKVKEIAAAGASQTDPATIIGDAATAQPWRSVALRYRLADGTYYASQGSSNPMDWPLNTRGSFQVATRPEIAATVLSWDGAPDYGTPVKATWNNTNLSYLDVGAEVEIWSMGAEALGGPGIAPDTWAIESTVTAAGATQFLAGLVIGQQQRHIALRYKIDSKYYAHSQDANPWLWPAASRSSLFLSQPRPKLALAWTQAGVTFNPTLLKLTVPEATSEDADAWYGEVWQAVWSAAESWSPDNPPLSAWTPLATKGPFSPQIFGAQYTVYALNSSYVFIFSARLLKGGPAFPSSYASNNPSDWPAYSRLIVPSI